MEGTAKMRAELTHSVSDINDPNRPTKKLGWFDWMDMDIGKFSTVLIYVMSFRCVDKKGSFGVQDIMYSLINDFPLYKQLHEQQQRSNIPVKNVKSNNPFSTHYPNQCVYLKSITRHSHQCSVQAYY